VKPRSARPSTWPAHGFESCSRTRASWPASRIPSRRGAGRPEGAGLVFGAAFLAVDFRRTRHVHARLAELPAYARALQRAGCAGRHLAPPSSDAFTYLQYFKQTARRLRDVARLLGDHDVRLGSNMSRQDGLAARRYPSCHAGETRELIAEIGVPSVGFVLDSGTGITRDGRRTCSAANRTGAVDLNERARTCRRTSSEQRARAALATGVIDAAGFLKALAAIGYDGPVRAEPSARRYGRCRPRKRSPPPRA